MGTSEASQTFESEEDEECKIIFLLGRVVDGAEKTEVVV